MPEHHAYSSGPSRDSDPFFDLDGDPVHAAFEEFRGRLQSALGPKSFSSWGTQLRLHGWSDHEVEVRAPSRLHCDRLTDQLGVRRLKAIWKAVDSAKRNLQLRPAGVDAAAQPTGAGVGVRGQAPNAPAASAVAEPGDAARTFDSFAAGSANQVAFAAAKALTLDPDPPFRVVFLSGDYGAGKTHLMQAAQAARPDALYFNADRFRSDFLASLRAKKGGEFKERVRASRLLLIDDVHILSGAASTQAELHHLVQEVLGEGGRVMVAAHRPLEELVELDPRLRARLAGAASCVLEKPDLDLRRRILAHMTRQNPYVRRGMAFPEEVIDFIASAVIGMPRELEAALNTVITNTALIGRPVTFESAKEALGDMLQGQGRRPTVEQIQKCVAQYHGMKVTDLLSRRRTREIVRPRQQAMFLCKEMTSRSLPDIGRRFANRDHTTVMHAVRRIKALCDDDPAVRADIEALRRLLRQGGPQAGMIGGAPGR